MHSALRRTGTFAAFAALVCPPSFSGLLPSTRRQCCWTIYRASGLGTDSCSQSDAVSLWCLLPGWDVNGRWGCWWCRSRDIPGFESKWIPHEIKESSKTGGVRLEVQTTGALNGYLLICWWFYEVLGVLKTGIKEKDTGTWPLPGSFV